ncbi:Y+L amino acid transporter 2-like [Dermacentor variabilis]|uniref:Y+L amino acid transporter 2-like n=1 Tax=Dermacentor variabilis TaxID=34621 RepID=UPI003F5C9B20
MGTMLPSAGGTYEYLKVAVESLGKTGDVICFLYCWCFVVADPMGAALHALTFTSYFLGLVYGTCTPPHLATALVTVAVIVPLLLEKFSFSGRTTPRGVVEAFAVAMFNGAGSTPICCMAEEMSDPCRTIPRALLGGLFLVTAVHVFTNMAYFVVLDPGSLTATEATAATFTRLT